MRIAAFTNAYKPGVTGVVTSISVFREGLISLGHDVHIFAPYYEGYADQEPYVFRFPALELPSQIEFSLVWPVKNLLEPTIRGIHPDVIHSHHPVLMGDLAASFAKEMNIPLVFTYHSQYEKYAQIYSPLFADLAVRVTEEIVRRYLGRCAHIIVPTDTIRETVLQKYDIDVGVTTVPTPIDLGQFTSADPARVRAEYGLEKAELLVTVGRLAKEKNLAFMIRAFSKVLGRRPNARLMIVGRGLFEQSLKSLVNKLDLKKKVIFAGEVDHARIHHYYAAADLFLFSAIAETQGLVLVEAMAAGTPVVAVRAPGAVDVLSAGGGVMTDADDALFAETIVSLLEDHDRRKQLGDEASTIAAGYGIQETSTRLVSAYAMAIDTVFSR
jgi:1,2-diacylglycerol 3-alpha-glucosyltransferase